MKGKWNKLHFAKSEEICVKDKLMSVTISAGVWGQF